MYIGNLIETISKPLVAQWASDGVLGGLMKPWELQKRRERIEVHTNERIESSESELRSIQMREMSERRGMEDTSENAKPSQKITPPTRLIIYI